MKNQLRWLTGAVLAFPLALLPACAGLPPAAAPQIVTVTQTEYLPIPAALLVPCLVPRGTPVTNGDLLILEQAFTVDLIACNAQLNRIKELKIPRSSHRKANLRANYP